MNSNGNIIKKHKNSNFTVVDNDILKNKNLSLKAKGLLIMLLSLPDDWEFSEAGLTALSKDGRDGLRSGLKELETFGYLKRTQEISGGKFGKIIYNIFETPLLGKPITEKPMSEKPITEKPMSEIPHNKELNNKELNNKELNNIKDIAELEEIDKENITSKSNITSINNKPYSPLEAFELFWNLYPKKNGKKPSSEKFLKLIEKSPELAEVIINDLTARKQTKTWTKDNGKYVPNATTYLNQERWQDELELPQHSELKLKHKQY